jgi:hypothetical protein
VEDVIHEERAWLDRARSSAGDSAVRSKDEPLVGVALSGGGVRSGATSLGFLMGLNLFGLLRHVDYMSTVSGGGYAGGLLTAERASDQEDVGGAGRDVNSRLFPPVTAASGDAEFSQASASKGSLSRLRELVVRCNYLIRQEGWLSRALLGVVAMGTVSICGIIFLTSLLAYVFRLLYKPRVLDFLRALGFEGDLIVPMTPAIGLFFLWLFCWLVSFFQKYRSATGVIASYVFRLLLFCAVVGVTMIAVTGDIEVDEFLRRTGVSEQLWEQLQGYGGWVKSGILALIGASLIPYFRPSALLRSGKERAAGPRKFLFVMARNGLLLGVPLISFGMFARENISNWQQERDWRLEYKDLVESKDGLDLGIKLKLFEEFETVRRPWWQNSGSWKDKLSKSLFNDLFRTEEILEEFRWFNLCERQYRALEAGEEVAEEGQLLSRLSGSSEISHVERFVEFSEFLLNECEAERDSGEFGQMLYWLHEGRKSQRRLMYLLNTQLLNADMCSYVHQTATCLLEKARAEKSAGGIAAGVKSQAEVEGDIAYLKKVIDAAREGMNIWHLTLSSAGKEDQPLMKDAACPMQEFLWAVMKQAGDSADSGPWKENIDFLSEIEALPASMQPLFRLNEKDPEADEPLAEVVTAEDRELILRSLLKANHRLLATIFPDTIRTRDGKSEVFSAVVHTRDQEVRLQFVLWSFVIGLVLSAGIDLNALSWHGYYARQLGMFWIHAGFPEHQKLTLERLSEKTPFRPLPLMNAAICLTGRSQSAEKPDAANPNHFLLSPVCCGSPHPDLGFVRTADSTYEDLRLEDAIALSGAALSPWATSNLLVKALLLVMNLRTGLWLPNPALMQPGQRKSRVFDVVDRHLFPPLRWLWLQFIPDGIWTLRPRDPEKWSHLLVTDGGHYENLGIESLLKRRCRLILALDASEDAGFEFHGLAIVMNRARTSDGIEFLDAHEDAPCGFPEKLVPDKETGYSADRFFAIRIKYPGTATEPPDEGLLLLIKSVILKKDPFELQQHRKEFPAFPNDPTSDQFFSPDKFEAYRYLGFTAARQLAELLKSADIRNATSLLDGIRRKFCPAVTNTEVTDYSALLDNLCSALNEYSVIDTAADDRRTVCRQIGRLLDKLRDTQLPESLDDSRVIDAAALRSRLQEITGDTEFTEYQESISKLLHWIPGSPVKPGKAKPGKRVATK